MVDVSVLTPSRNYGRFIEDAVESVALQDGVSMEHIVQDAESQDETVEILSRSGHRIDWRSEPDRSQSDALNKALSRASGTWVAWLNADEFYLSGALRHLVEVAEKVNADVVYGECAIVDAEGRFVRLLPEHRFNARILKEYGCYISSACTIFRRAVLDHAPWDEGVRRMMDWDLFMRLAERGARFAHTAWPVGAFRVHESQVTAAPHSAFHDENAVVTARYGRPSDPIERWKASRGGRVLHRVYKAYDGAYLRQWRARSLRGLDLRWFRGDDRRFTTDLLVRRCYRSAGGGARARA
jgi:glycosyltransferase involved in cell wall biosynthesis